MTRRIDRSLALAGLPPLERSAWIEVDTDALTANARALHSLSAPAALGAVVKADGYGHGLEMAARCAVAGGAEWLCVADAAEAARLRLDGYPGRIFVLYPVPPAILPAMASLRVDVTMGSLNEALTVANRLAPDDPILAVHLEVDTGMTRGGVAPDEAVAAAAAIVAASSVTLAGVWTHLAAPEDPGTTGEQITRFNSALGELYARKPPNWERCWAMRPIDGYPDFDLIPNKRVPFKGAMMSTTPSVPKVKMSQRNTPSRRQTRTLPRKYGSRPTEWKGSRESASQAESLAAIVGILRVLSLRRDAIACQPTCEV